LEETMTVADQAYNALAVLTKDSVVRNFLERADPKALEQAEAAMRALKGNVGGPEAMTLASKGLVELKMTKAEAWAMFRALGVALESDQTDKGDKGPIQWVGDRLARLLDEKFFGVPLPGPAAGA
jgi:hypothetical protein